MFYVYEKREKMIEKISINLILKQNQNADLKSFWDWLYKFDFCKDLILFFGWSWHYHWTKYFL